MPERSRYLKPSTFARKLDDGKQYANRADVEALEADPLSYDVLTAGLGAAKLAAVTPAMHWGKVANKLEEIFWDSPSAQRMVRSVRDDMPRRVNPKLMELIQPERIMRSDYLNRYQPSANEVASTGAQMLFSLQNKEAPRFFFGHNSAWTVPHEFFHAPQAGYMMRPMEYPMFANSGFFPVPGLATGKQIRQASQELQEQSPKIFARGISLDNSERYYPYLQDLATNPRNIIKDEGEIMADLAAAMYYGEPWYSKVAPPAIQQAIRRVYAPGSLGNIFGVAK